MVSQRQLLSTGSVFERELAYSRAVVAGDWCFVAGVTGYDYKTMSLPEDVAAQTRQCFVTINAVLLQAGFTMADIVRVQYTITDRSFVDALKPVLQEYMANVRPAATLVVAGLLDPAMKVEVEVTAFRG
jgi:enamine deaminase RidA (YjgF/YER057c/UK114 family)